MLRLMHFPQALHQDSYPYGALGLPDADWVGFPKILLQTLCIGSLGAPMLRLVRFLEDFIKERMHLEPWSSMLRLAHFLGDHPGSQPSWRQRGLKLSQFHFHLEPVEFRGWELHKAKGLRLLTKSMRQSPSSIDVLHLAHLALLLGDFQTFHWPSGLLSPPVSLPCAKSTRASTSIAASFGSSKYFRAKRSIGLIRSESKPGFPMHSSKFSGSQSITVWNKGSNAYSIPLLKSVLSVRTGEPSNLPIGWVHFSYRAGSVVPAKIEILSFYLE